MSRPAQRFERLLVAAAAVLVGACGDGGSGGTGDAASTADPQDLGAPCLDGADCKSGVCLRSEYGTPFCSRSCDLAWEPCPAGSDAATGEALCISFETLPNPSTPAFTGELDRFCAPRCTSVSECTAGNDGWEACDVPRYLGDPLFPQLGNVRVCQSPSYQGKDPVDPALCDWQKTVGSFANESNLCISYCRYLERCKELDSEADLECCQWGCFNAIVIEDKIQDAWSDEIRCFIDNHEAFPEVGPLNACTEPPKNCGGPPTDPTPPAARPTGAM